MKRSRCGKSLLELVVVISIMSIVLGMSATSLATLFRVNAQLSRDAQQAQALDRLAARLRSDAHQAASASLDEGCTLTLADGSAVRYAFVAPKIIREVRRDGAIAHHDTFALPKNATARFESGGDANPRLIRLSVHPGELRMPARDLPRGTTIEVAVGLLPAVAQKAREP